ncbi:hypothetical protein JQS43_21970 [Natronosporangium hydrolyticum]|uniref:Uncharacterized protein n=1 Tax=Natronosporangium hydrolyticum TaxID=2811111 RepID=A0A895Y9Y4_9ACTN|nr:hypothetical protein [Natronosporangium hydrolyticum]QSB14161.1 hypothetical protein JQS43_21970 [Natronosporangium hydrolyticum]
MSLPGSGHDLQAPQRRTRWLLHCTIAAAILLVAVVVAVGVLWDRSGVDCESWSDEFIGALEDGTLSDGTFEASEVCREQMRRDLDRLSD